MADVVLFHHIQGLTPGVRALAARWRAGGHTVHTPDLYGGRTFSSIEDGATYSSGVGRPDLAALADEAVAGLPAGLVYAGISSGVMQAQRLAQTRPGAAGAVLLESCLPVSGEWAIGPWPDGVPVQVHGMDADGFSPVRATSTPPASSSSPRATVSCSSTRATSTSSRTARCRRTTRRRPTCSPSGCLRCSRVFERAPDLACADRRGTREQPGIPSRDHLGPTAVGGLLVVVDLDVHDQPSGAAEERWLLAPHHELVPGIDACGRRAEQILVERTQDRLVAGSQLEGEAMRQAQREDTDHVPVVTRLEPRPGMCRVRSLGRTKP